MKRIFELKTDSYKLTHWPQYPIGTEYVVSYLESRGGEFDETLFYGLQFIIKEHLLGQVITQESINYAEKFAKAHFGMDLFNREGFEYILKEHGGKLPIKIKAAPEGVVIPTKNVLLTIENTDPKCFWLTNFVESLILQVYYPITVATLSYTCKKEIKKAVAETSSLSKEEQEGVVNFMLHDFGLRGSTVLESAEVAGSAHLLNFLGTDTMLAIVFAQHYYNTDAMVGLSVFATEHSTVTSHGKENELAAYEHFIDIHPSGILSCVSDSWDIMNACDLWGDKLKEKVLARDGRLVIRPDSGDPKITVLAILERLWHNFGGEVNEKGYRVLHPKVRVLQGDGISRHSLKELLDAVVKVGFAAENMIFGMGGALVQKDINRDTLNFAIKCSSITINGEERDVQKDPIVFKADGTRVQSFKKSKAGKLKLIFTKDGFKTVSADDKGVDVLKTVFENGEMVKEYTFEEIKDHVKIYE